MQQITIYDLTPRQQAIMRALASGKSNQEIADSLNLKISTVRNAVSSVYAQAGLGNRVQALLWVLRQEQGAA